MRSNPNPGGNARFGEIFRSLATHRMIREINCADSGSGMQKMSLGGRTCAEWRSRHPPPPGEVIVGDLG